MKETKKLLVGLIFILTMTMSFDSFSQVQPYFGGVGIGSPAPEGLHCSLVYIPITGNQMNDSNGDEITSIDFGTGPMDTSFDLNIQSFAFNCTWVSSKKILGGNYAAFVILPYVASKNMSFSATAPDGSIIPMIAVDNASGILDMVISPINLSWTKPKYDLTAGVALNTPIGSYDAGAAKRWCLLPNVGGTYYFDSKKSFSISTKLTYEINGKQQVEDLDLTYGDELIIEWGIGKMFIPFGRIGIIGYSDFQTTKDTGANMISDVLHSSHSIGGEYMMFLPPINLGISLRAVKGISAKDTSPISLFMVGLTKTFNNSNNKQN